MKPAALIKAANVFLNLKKIKKTFVKDITEIMRYIIISII